MHPAYYDKTLRAKRVCYAGDKHNIRQISELLPMRIDGMDISDNMTKACLACLLRDGYTAETVMASCGLKRMYECQFEQEVVGWTEGAEWKTFASKVSGLTM